MLSYSRRGTNNATSYRPTLSIQSFCVGEECTCCHISLYDTDSAIFYTVRIYRHFVLERNVCAVIFPHTTQTVQFSILLVYGDFVLERGVRAVIFPHTTQTVFMLSPL